MMRRWQILVFALILGLPLFAVLAQEPRASVGFKPLTEMSADDRYKGEDGGLYGHGKNTPRLCRPLAHPRSDQWRRSAEFRRGQRSGHRAASALRSLPLGGR